MLGAASPKLECDLVMRGGITSGIVYPKAIAKLAETYRFRSIGGTSAGAIAAVATAAAAFGARTGENHFQTRIKVLPEELAGKKRGKTVLQRLFQPPARDATLVQCSDGPESFRQRGSIGSTRYSGSSAPCSTPRAIGPTPSSRRCRTIVTASCT
jgi:hypothetical protein